MSADTDEEPTETVASVIRSRIFLHTQPGTLVFSAISIPDFAPIWVR